MENDTYISDIFNDDEQPIYPDNPYDNFMGNGKIISSDTYIPADRNDSLTQDELYFDRMNDAVFGDD